MLPSACPDPHHPLLPPPPHTQVRHLLKLSPEKWEEVCQHALAKPPTLCCPPTHTQVRHLLKLSPEKWEEVCQHALAAVVPDFRNRVWWCPNIRTGLLFQCKNGSVGMEHPIGE